MPDLVIRRDVRGHYWLILMDGLHPFPLSRHDTYDAAVDARRVEMNRYVH